MAIPEHDPVIENSSSSPPANSHHPSSFSPPTNKWGPYSSARDFNANMATILIILFCTLIFILVLNAAIRFFLRRRRPSPTGSPDAASTKPVKQLALVESLPTLVFSRGTKLAGTGAECTICLSEFVVGETVHVLPACNHGFHLKCAEGWLSTRSSCPTCRSSCRVVEGTGGTGAGTDSSSPAEGSQGGGGQRSEQVVVVVVVP